MLKLNTPGLIKVAGSNALARADKIASEAILAASKTSKEINTEIKFIAGGMLVDAFAEELSAAAGVFGITIDPLSLSTFGKVLATGGAVSVANKFYNNFSEIDLSKLSKEEIEELLEMNYDDDEEEEVQEAIVIQKPVITVDNNEL